ncbi:aminotransferase class V-fold PLP-dependent enzyme [Noviherbaspirillum denitrificans]|uniref:Glutamate decarboxylase n=1 Tax=Noviherbaspirillum denitrificans TaxID=1968433 RepID=A0A254TI57_9BURK|nr:aminotransferase class V-fold PLP-dependent enzyme [Noviherbaspirillum denitrificans]OWW22319.1 glutamate decarboxylase [Noviherbaspirillum denitrificans]
MEELLKTYFSAQDLDENAASLQQALQLIREWLFVDKRHAYPPDDFESLKKAFNTPAMPQDGSAFPAVLDALQQQVFAHSVPVNHPKYIGHMTQALPWVSVLVESFIATLNQNQVKIETAYSSTLIEKQVLGWMHRQIYRFDDAFYRDSFESNESTLGNMVNGGTMGNLTALSVALESQMPGLRKKGFLTLLREKDYTGFAVIASARVHYSVKKSLATLGLGEDALCVIPTDENNRIRLDVLEERIAELKQRKVKILALIGVAGTTETGSIDPLEELGRIAQREDIWFHVDAAWGGALLLAEKYRDMFHGVEMADSVVIDGHKLFWVTMAQGMVLFKSDKSLNHLLHTANYIIRKSSGDLGRTSLEGSRRFDALKLWFSFKLFGLKGYEALLDRCQALAANMRELVMDDPDFELITCSDTFILTYRYAPRELQARLKDSVRTGDRENAVRCNETLNRLNTALQDEQKRRGLSFVSRTLLESTPYPGQTTVLRVVLTNMLTTQEDLKEILAEQKEIGAGL